MVDRPVTGADLAAHLTYFGPPDADREAFAGRIHPDAQVADMMELERRCPPAAIGLTPGGYAALFTPLFGEFE